MTLTAHPTTRSLPVPRPDPAPEAPALVDLREVAGTLKRRRAWLLASTLIVMTATGAFLALRTPYYAATTQLLLDPRGLQVVDKDLTPASQSSEGGMAIVESQMRVIASERVLRALIDKEGLDRDPEFVEPGLFGRLIGAARTALGVPARTDPAWLTALRELQQRVAVQRGEKNYVVDVAVSTADPQKSARLADALASIYVDSDFAARAAAAQRVEMAMAGRLDELRDQVRQAEDRVETFKAENNIVDAGGKLVSEQQLSDLNAQLAAARARTAELKVRAEQIQRARAGGAAPDAIAEAVASPTITQLRGQLAEVRRRQSIAVDALGPRHPQIAMMTSQVHALQGQIADELARIASAARTDYERALANETALARSLDDLKSHAVETSRAFVRLRELEREGEASRSVYESFLRRVKEVGEQQAVDSGNARVISFAVPPSRPAGFPRWLILFGAGLGSLLLGGAGALLHDQLATPVRSRRQLADRVGLPILATLPPLPADPVGGAVDGPAFPAPEQLDGLAALPLRRLWQTVAAHGRGNGLTTVLFVSPSPLKRPHSGAALAFAASLKAAGKTVLFIDGRTRRAAATGGQGVKAGPGWMGVLRGGAGLRQAVGEQAPAALGWLPAGGNTAELRPSGLDLRRSLWPQVAADYDVVVIDAGSTRSDAYAAAFADAADHVIVAVEEGQTSLADVEAEIEALSSEVETLRGLTLTMLPA